MTYMTPERFIVGMKKTPIILDEILKDVTQETAIQARDGADGWSIVEVMCHLRDYEEIFVARVRAMLAEENPTFPNYNQEQLAIERSYQTQDLRAAQAAQFAARTEFLSILENLPLADWQRAGTHPVTGRITIMEQAMQATLHDVTHIEQMVHTLTAFRGK